MIITKAQSKQLRYACGAVDYNQPCTRKYTGTPEGKLREIGRFKYIENGGELKSFEYLNDGVGVSLVLHRIQFPELIQHILQNVWPTAEQVEQAKSVAPAPVEISVEAEPHPVDVPVEVEVHSDMRTRDAEFTAIDELNPGATPEEDAWASPEEIEAWTEPDETEKIPKNEEPVDPLPLIKEPTEEGYVEPDLPDMTPQQETPLDANGLPKIERDPMTREEFETALRETSMNAAAREALRLCRIECGPECFVAANILRANATVPGFLDNYGKCLEKVGNPLTIAEIAEALPAQKKWLDGLALNDYPIKD